MEVRPETGPGAVPSAEGLRREAASMVNGVRRRRSRQAVSRPRVIQFSLTEEEFAEISGAATRAGLAHGAFDTGMLTVNGGLRIHLARQLADAIQTDPL